MIRIGIFYINRSNPAAGERLVRVLAIRVYRPPVLMIHGLWSDANAFTVMEQTLAGSHYEPFQLSRLDYGGSNDSSFKANLPLIAGGIRAAIQGSANADLAAGKIDLVTHSMGGVLSRLYLQDPRYQHEVRRLITSNAPHAGSQMANLLLDTSFDSQGGLCSMLSQAMSSPTAPNRSCNNGAVADLQVSSPATTNDLNLGVHPTDVAVHAVTTVFDLADFPDLSGLVEFFGGPAPGVMARLVRACSLSLIDHIFNFDDSDLIVSATSQAGGLSGSLRSDFLGQAHMEVPRFPGPVANAAVVERVKELLNEPDNSSSFTRSGFSPGQLGYTTPSLCPLFRRARTLGAARSTVATGISITSPASGSTATPGEPIVVEVAGSPDIATVLLVLSQPRGATVMAEQPGPDARFDLAIPETAVGLQNVVVGGLDASGLLVAVSDTVTVDVTVPSELNSITVYPPVVYLQPCTTATLEVTGHYEDGVDRALSLQPGLSMAFTTGSAAQSGAGGVVLNEELDDTLTVTFDGVDSAPVPIRALVPDDLGACGAETTTTTTVPPSTTSTSTPDPATTTTTTAPGSSTTTTTTPTPETSSTTTTPASSTTTSTLLPACQADADCDDGDACTGDVCTPAGCEHVAATGLDGAECLLATALAEPLCPAGTIDPKLEQFASQKLQRALGLVQQAALATKPRRQRRLLAKADRALGRIVRRKPGATTDECLQLLAVRIDDILDVLAASSDQAAG